jgi:TrmH family RNA methyltransferase
VKAAVRLRESARARRAQGLFFLEGFRLCRDAMHSGYAPQTLFLTEAAKEKYGNGIAANGIAISQAVALKLGDTQHPQGIFGIFCKPAPRADFWQPGGRYIALEQVQDPGNLGGIARTAQALGLSGMLLCGGCDLWHPKALRASMGALLRLAVLETEDLAAELRRCGLPCYAAVPNRAAAHVAQCDFSGGAVVAVGNEGSGLRPETIAACGSAVTVPMPGQAESLNAFAAATILMWELCAKSEMV